MPEELSEAWSGKKAGGLFGVLSGVVSMAASKEILDTLRPEAEDNLTWAIVVGTATGIVVGSLTGAGVLGVNIFAGRKRVVGL